MKDFQPDNLSIIRWGEVAIVPTRPEGFVGIIAIKSKTLDVQVRARFSRSFYPSLRKRRYHCKLIPFKIYL
jgi:hypothetical protein